MAGKKKRGGGHSLKRQIHWHAKGWENGYHMGRCEAVMKQIPPVNFPKREIKVLYVAEGSPGYYGIDFGVTEALSGMTRELVVASPFQNIASLTAEIKPDLVFVLSGVLSFPAEQVDAIRAQGIRTAVWFADDPYFTGLTTGYAPHYDFIFTHELGCIPFYRELGCSEVHYLPFAASASIFHPRHVDISVRRDVSFIGTAFPNRIQFFNPVVPYLASKNVLIAGGLWNRLKLYSRIKRKIMLEGIMPPATADYYTGAQIVINLHRHFDDRHNKRNLPALSINPRTFEVGACGTLQLTDVRHDLTGFYTPGHEIVTYASPDDLIQKIDHYLRHEEERREIALRGLNRTLREHTYHHRMENLLTVIFGPAP